ncbi:MAG: ribulokinase [Pedobacter sp.]|nr:MAG: ribulokinase [Pedobacter sp.]
MSAYVIGLDFGTDSVRSMLVDALTGAEVSTAVVNYPRWAKGLYCDPSVSMYRQHPLDYLEAMEESVLSTLASHQDKLNAVKGISLATTGSTPVAVDENGTPLALLPAFAENPNGMFMLWKDHTATAEAEAINATARSWAIDFTKYSGGTYSPEWYFSKILHVLRVDAAVAEKAYSWVEHCDWMPAVLTGNTRPDALKRSRCVGGHKAMWHEDFDGLPAQDFLDAVDPLFSNIRERLYKNTYTSDESAGVISAEWATKFGLPSDVQVGVGALDAHFGAVGAFIEPFTMVKVMGTSTCDMMIVPLADFQHQLIKGICGQVNGSIVPSMLGMEAGQSAFGDVYKWFEEILSFPLSGMTDETLRKQLKAAILPELNRKAALLPLSADDEVALDWINGRRTPDADMHLKGIITGLTLGTTAPRIFKALVEATAFGSKAIIARFRAEGVPVKQVVVLGGISKKSTFVLQTLANVLDMPIQVVKSEQACALGAAMFAATIGHVYPDLQSAQEAMASGFDATFLPEEEKVTIYAELFAKYLNWGSVAINH